METDERSFGDLFYDVVDELADITFDHALSLIFSALIDSVREIFHATDEQDHRAHERHAFPPARAPQKLSVCGVSLILLRVGGDCGVGSLRNYF